MEEESSQVELRSRMVDNDDPRVRRTRRKLVDAFRDLLDEGRSPTVTAVVARADVTRSSFYAHFSGISDLAATALTEFNDAVISLARVAVREGGSKREVNERAILDVARFVSDRRETYGALLSRGEAFTKSIVAAFAEQSLQTLRTRDHVDGNPEVTARFIAGGVMSVLVWWLEEGHDLTAEDLAQALMAISPRDFVD